MQDTTGNGLQSGLVYEGHLPLSWMALAAVPEEAVALEREQHNLDVLRTLIALDSHHPELGDEIADGGVPESVRVDFKLNLLLDLVGQLVARQVAVPASRRVRLTPEGMGFWDDAPPPLGAVLSVELFLNLKYPRPVTLVGRVVGTDPGAGADLEFLGLTGPVQQGLERFIFAHHRRAVALSRRRRS